MARALARAGLRPTFALTTTHVQVAIEIVARTDYLAVIPERIARQARHVRPIRVLPMPIDAGRFSLALYWHARTDQDPLHAWLRDRFAQIAKQTYLDPARSDAR
jgi:DNA-binding transcriptional LysR family regulator